jgi:membrane protein
MQSRTITVGKTGLSFFQRLAAKWQADNIGGLGAALAYFALFSLFPLLLVILSIVGYVVNPQSFDMQSWLLGAIDSPELRSLIGDTLTSLRESRGQAGLIGFGTLLLAASGIFAALDKAMHVIWEVPEPPPAKNFLITIWRLVSDKLVTFLLVLGCALLLMLSIGSTVAISALSSYTSGLLSNGLLWQTMQLLASTLLLGLGLMIIFKVMPDRPVAWRDAAVGALCSALLLALLQKVIGFYLSQANYGSYGAVGGVMALMVYFYLTSQVILLGAACAAITAKMRSGI